MNSLLHGAKGSLFAVQMGSRDEYFRVSSRTQQIIPRSASQIQSYIAQLNTDCKYRVLLATIRGMKSIRPCPRCLIPKSEFPNLGLPEDQERRNELKRVDNPARNHLVTQARSIIFTDGRAVTYQSVEKLMKPQSYVPIEVRLPLYLCLMLLTDFELLFKSECILSSTTTPWF